MHELDRIDTLREHKILIDRMSSRDAGSIATKPCQRDMRPKRPVVRLPKRQKKDGPQFCDIRPSRAFRPQKTRPSRLRTIADMLELQGKVAKAVGHATKLLDCIRYGTLVPRWHQREMNVGRSDETDRKSLQPPHHLRELVSNVRRDLERDENSCRLRTDSVCRYAIDLVRVTF